MADHRADAAIWAMAQGLFVLNLTLLLVLWLLPMPDAAGVPGRAPRLVIGS